MLSISACKVRITTASAMTCPALTGAALMLGALCRQQAAKCVVPTRERRALIALCKWVNVMPHRFVFWSCGMVTFTFTLYSISVQAEGDLQNGAAAKRKRKGPSVKERLMRCQRTERERLTFGKASLMRACLHARPHMLRPWNAFPLTCFCRAFLSVTACSKTNRMELPACCTS